MASLMRAPWSDSNIRIPSQRPLLRMLESKGPRQKTNFWWRSGFDIRVRTRVQAGRECQVHSSKTPLPQGRTLSQYQALGGGSLRGPQDERNAASELCTANRIAPVPLWKTRCYQP